MSDPLSPTAMWDERYRHETYAYGLAPNEFLASAAHRFAPNMRALIPGDGEGRKGRGSPGWGLRSTRSICPRSASPRR